MANEATAAVSNRESLIPERSPRPAALFFSFLRLGATAFGGPAMVQYIGELATRRKRWLSKEEFAEGVALCQSIPGATAMQTSAFVGLRAAGVRGAAAAYIGFGLPAVLLMVIASAVYGQLSGIDAVQAVLRGFRAMTVALIANAALRFARANLRSISDVLVAAGCALALYVKANPVAVIAAAVLLEVVLLRRAPSASFTAAPRSWPPGIKRTVLMILVVALAILVLLLVFAPRLGALGAVCLKVDALAFGGGFTSVPLMFREVVGRSWLDAKTFMDGIALGQVTPGPIVVTATFVGYQVAGVAGALVATVGIFFPSFVMVVAAAPWFGSLRAKQWYGPAIHGALLSFVGLLVFVTFQFGTALSWNAGAAILATLVFAALLKGVDVIWVVLASGLAAAFLL